MDLRYHLPRADLCEFVRAYYLFETGAAPAVQPLCAEMGNIRVILNGGGVLHTPDGRSHRSASAFLVGPTMGASLMQADANTRVFGVGIRPKGWVTLCGLPAEEAADTVIDLTSFAGGMARASIDEMRNAPDFEHMVIAADRFFADLVARRTVPANTGYSRALASWLLNPADPGLDALVAAMDVSRRQTDRIAKLYFGASPKFLRRKYRALRAADRIRFGGADGLGGAGDGFYDQSHFIKEFRTFIGVTPRQFSANQAALITEIQDQRRLQSLQLPLASF